MYAMFMLRSFLIFRWQTKPRLTIHGDLYYEGKEFETRLKEKKPGDLSVELRTALGMPVGPNAHKVICNIVCVPDTILFTITV